MTSKIILQLQDFLCHHDVASLYSRIHKLHPSKLQEALGIRGLSREGDESTLRVRLLRFEVKFYHPEIHIPWHDGHDKISKQEALYLGMSVDALRDMTRTLCFECTGDVTNDAQAITPDTEKPKTCTTNAAVSDSSDKDSNTESQVKYRLNCVKLLKVCNLQYNGVRGLAAQEFLANLNDFRKFSKITDRVLLEMLACVFDVDTRKWYRANNFADWQSFEQKFVEDHVNMKRQTVDRATQTDRVANETRNYVVDPLKKSVNMPVSKTLQDLKDSLSSIGFKTANCTKPNIPTVSSSNRPVKAPVQSKIDATTRQTSNVVNKPVNGSTSSSSTSKSNTPTTSNSSLQSPTKVVSQNNPTIASTASDKSKSSSPILSQLPTNAKVMTQSPINSPLNAIPSNNSIVCTEVPTIAVNPAIRNIANSNKPIQVVVNSQPIVSQNNTPVNYATQISSTQPTTNNVMTSVNQGQIMYHPIDSQILSSTNGTLTGGCYLYAHTDCNAPNSGQKYLTSQPLNYGYGTYHYPIDQFNIINGFRPY